MEEHPAERPMDELLADLNAPDPENRLGALNALAELGVKNQSILQQLRIVARGDPDENVRKAAARTLRSLGTRLPADASNDFWQGFLVGFLGWYLVNGLIWYFINDPTSDGQSRLFNLFIFPANLLVLIVLSAIRRTQAIGLGILAALGLNLVLSLILGTVMNGICFFPFYLR
jgi:hypothetical protein